MFRLFKPESTVVIAAAMLTLVANGVSADDRALPASGTESGLAADVFVNGEAISANHVRLMSAGIDAQKGARALGNDDAKAAARAELITEEVLAQAARKKGLEKRADVTDQLAYQERLILSRAYLEDYFDKNPVNDDTLRTAYEWNRSNGKIVEYRVRQVLVSSPAAAQDAIAALKKGEDFAVVAKRFTQDPGGQENGGDLGWFRPDTFVDHHFSDAVVALKKGEYSKTPVRSRFGWHVVKLEEGPRVVAKPLPYNALDDASREALRQRTAQIKIEGLTAQLTKGAKISGPGASNGTARSAK